MGIRPQTSRDVVGVDGYRRPLRRGGFPLNLALNLPSLILRQRETGARGFQRDRRVIPVFVFLVDPRPRLRLRGGYGCLE